MTDDLGIEQFQQWLNSELNSLRRELNMETGIVSFIQDGKYLIVAVDSAMGDAFSPGMAFAVEDTYCYAVCCSKQQVRYLNVGEDQSMRKHPVYLAVKLEAYIGSPILEGADQVYGTVNFTSIIPKATDFNAEQISLVETFAQQISARQKTILTLVDSLPQSDIVN